jgi:hypothetical protein
MIRDEVFEGARANVVLDAADDWFNPAVVEVDAGAEN